MDVPFRVFRELASSVQFLFLLLLLLQYAIVVLWSGSKNSERRPRRLTWRDIESVVYVSLNIEGLKFRKQIRKKNPLTFGDTLAARNIYISVLNYTIHCVLLIQRERVSERRILKVIGLIRFYWKKKKQKNEKSPIMFN